MVKVLVRRIVGDSPPRPFKLAIILCGRAVFKDLRVRPLADRTVPYRGTNDWEVGAATGKGSF